MIREVPYIFVISDELEKENVLDVNSDYYIISRNDMVVNVVDIILVSLQEQILNIKDYHLRSSYIYSLFTLGLPEYRFRFYVAIILNTIERTFRLFRQSIYDKSLQQLHQLRLSGKIEIDEALFGCTREGGKRGCGSLELSTKILYLASTREME